MIKKEGNDPLIYKITRKSTNARRQSSNGNSSSSSLYNNFHNSPLSQIDSIQNDELDDDDEFDDEYQDNLKELNENEHLSLIAFDKSTTNLSNLNKLNLAANYLNNQQIKQEQIASLLHVSNESLVGAHQQATKRRLFNKKQLNKQNKRKLKLNKR